MDSQTSAGQFRLGFIGAGKLAGSVMSGLIRAKFCAPHEIIASEPNDDIRNGLRGELGIAATTDNAEVARETETILIAVKPNVVLPVLRDLGSRIQNKLIISLAAGVRLPAMEAVAEARFMRGLTNTPSAACQGATAITRGARTTKNDFLFARNIFEAVGVVVEVNEDQIDAVTALSGSGPAFVYTVIEALAQGGVKMGLSEKDALILANQTVLGAAYHAKNTGMSLEQLIKMVVTPGGTTAAGLAAMEKQGTSEGLIAAVEAATKRGQEMARENS